jgi:hypothetical protein
MNKKKKNEFDLRNSSSSFERMQTKVKQFDYREAY